MIVKNLLDLLPIYLVKFYAVSVYGILCGWTSVGGQEEFPISDGNRHTITVRAATDAIAIEMESKESADGPSFCPDECNRFSLVMNGDGTLGQPGGVLVTDL